MNVFAVLGDQGTYAPMGFKVTEYISATNQETPYDMVIHVGTSPERGCDIYVNEKVERRKKVR